MKLSIQYSSSQKTGSDEQLRWRSLSLGESTICTILSKCQIETKDLEESLTST